MIIVDMRFRPPFKGFLNLHVWKDWPFTGTAGASGASGAEAPPSLQQKSMDLMWREMDEAGITIGGLIGRRAVPPYENVPNEDILELARLYPDRLVPIPCIEPSDRGRALEELEFLLGLPEVKAIHLEPGWAGHPRRADDPNLYPIYERLEQAGMPLWISYGGWIGPDFDWVSPIHIQHVAWDFPKLRIGVGHGGWPWIQQALAVAYACPNVYLAPDMYLNMPMPGVLDYVTAANFYLADRLIFGTAYPARPMLQSVEAFKRLPFNPGVLEKAIGLNALRFLNLRVPVTA